MASGRREGLKGVWLAVTIAVVLGTYAPQLGAPFELQDDHRIIAPRLTPQANVFSTYVAELRQDVHAVGRFRPVNQVFDVFGPVILGPRPLVWHALSLILAVAVAALLFQIGLRVFGIPAAAAVFALITLLAPDPGPTATWYRLGPKEAWGMLFVAGALAMMVSRRAEIGAFVLAALAAYSKESFLLLVPALFGVRLWLETQTMPLRAAMSRLRFVALAYAMLFLVGLAGIVIALQGAGQASYGARSLARSPAGITRVVWRDAARAPMLAAWFIPALLAFWVKRPRLLPLAVFLAWVGPQYALYATRGGFWDHYWLPCVVAFAAVNASGMAILAKERRRVLFGVAMSVFCIWMLNAIRIDVAAVRNFKAKAEVQQQAVRVAAAGTTPGSTLIIVGDADVVAGETAPSFADFVRFEGGRHGKAFWFDSRCKGERCVLRELATNAIAPPVDPAEVSVVAWLDETESSPPLLRAWYDATAFNRVTVRGDRRFLSLRERAWTKIPFDLRVDVRKRASL
jgi:hypothetical protein